MSAQVITDRGILLGDNQRDYNHVTDGEYQRLRDLANLAYSKKQKYSQCSQSAYKSGDKAEAHKYSVDAQKQAQIAENYNFQAAEYVFRANNADSDSNDIDLHGLYIKEAEFILKRRIIAGIQRQESKLEVIVGKGLHSPNHIAKLKPAVEELCHHSGLSCHVDSKNTGVLIISLKNARIPQDWTNLAPLYEANQETVPQNNTLNGSAQQYYSQPQQPQYQSQNQSQYQQNSGQSNTESDLGRMLTKLFCVCIKNLFN